MLLHLQGKSKNEIIEIFIVVRTIIKLSFYFYTYEVWKSIVILVYLYVLGGGGQRIRKYNVFDIFVECTVFCVIIAYFVPTIASNYNWNLHPKLDWNQIVPRISCENEKSNTYIHPLHYSPFQLNIAKFCQHDSFLTGLDTKIGLKSDSATISPDTEARKRTSIC